jgi:predicted 3-demethylubiquinone-9 3-methyltransferase (glyoxalase superfamily)
MRFVAVYSSIVCATNEDSPQRDESSSEECVSARIRVGGIDVVAVNGDLYGDFSVSSAVSIRLTSEDESEVDFYWVSLEAESRAVVAGCGFPTSSPDGSCPTPFVT